MHLYNVEIVSPDFVYQSSYQIGQVEFTEDYLSPDNNKVELPDIRAKQGDYILLTGPADYAGIITSYTETERGYELQFKSLLSLTDIDVHFDKADLKTVSLEEWLAHILNATFRDNEDPLQNVTGFSAVAEPETYKAVIDTETNIGNLYEILKEALLLYGVVVDFVIEVGKKRLTAAVRTRKKESPVIEADLPNILQPAFTIKQADVAANKMVIYNELNEVEHVAFYMLQDGSITADSGAAGRIRPVVSQTIYIAHEETDEESFYDMAYVKAGAGLIKEKHNCLIELTVQKADTLVKPWELEIGQKAKIIHKNTVYDTVLTGKKQGETTTLLFGAVRLELTKILKGRIKK